MAKSGPYPQGKVTQKQEKSQICDLNEVPDFHLPRLTFVNNDVPDNLLDSNLANGENIFHSHKKAHLHKNRELWSFAHIIIHGLESFAHLHIHS